MNDINEMPPKCQYCPYWEVCEYPWVCPDREQLTTNLQQTCSATDTISRQMAIDAMLKLQAEDVEMYGCRIPEGFDGDRAKEALEQLPSAQPKSYREGYQAGFKDAQPEQKRGKWIYNSPVTMKCNQCELVIKDWDWHRFKYCPNCCARMENSDERFD